MNSHDSLLQFVLSAFVACASAVYAPYAAAPYAAAYPAYGAAYHAPIHAPLAYPAAVKTIAPAYGYAGYGGYHGAPIVKAAYAHPVATSYANTYKVAASYPAYHAPLAAYHAPIAGKIQKISFYFAQLTQILFPAPIVKAAYPAYAGAYPAYGAAYHAPIAGKVSRNVNRH